MSIELVGLARGRSGAARILRRRYFVLQRADRLRLLAVFLRVKNQTMSVEFPLSFASSTRRARYPSSDKTREFVE